MKEVAAVNMVQYRKQLRTYFLKLAPDAKQSELDELIAQYTYDVLPKKEIFLEPGQSSNMTYFICKGLVRIYYIKEDKEITTWFIQENMLFASTYSILTGEPNYSYYETLEETYVLKVEYSVLESFYTKYHSLERMGRNIIQTYYGSFMKKTFDVLFLSAEERYNLFLKDHGDLLNRVPLRFVASYIGITQETLSRLRSKH